MQYLINANYFCNLILLLVGCNGDHDSLEADYAVIAGKSNLSQGTELGLSDTIIVVNEDGNFYHRLKLHSSDFLNFSSDS